MCALFSVRAPISARAIELMIEISRQTVKTDVAAMARASASPGLIAE
jgi:hypothetical protein